MNRKVSVVTPSYNSERYIARTIESVQAQTYTDWEMVIVDDCSTDSTRQIVQSYADKDPRIRLLTQKENAGAAMARTRSMRESTGRFVAYLDADDIWLPEKLEKQVKFMLDNDCGFSCTSYEVIDDAGNRLNKEVHMWPKIDYMGFLTNLLLQTVGIMVDTEKVDRELLVMPNIRRAQDAATWLQILKAGHECYGIYEVLAQYRRAKNSLSSNKLVAIKRTWNLFRNVEHLSLPMCCYCFVRYAVLAVWKRTYLRGKA